MIERGTAALQHAHYKDAVNVFKQLIRTDARDEWKQGLARAYHGRARELSAKGMYEEALTVLGNAINQDPSIDAADELIHWSICAGRYKAAVTEYFKARDRLDKDRLDRFESLFALALLSGNNELTDCFPDDSKIKTQLPTIRRAIEAYCRNDDQTLADLLAQISFHSPYRDLRSILSALSSHASGSTGATDRLAKIPEKSAFKPAAGIVEQAVSADLDAPKLARVSNPARAFILAVQAVDNRNWNLAAKILRPPVSARNLFNLLISDPLPQMRRLVQDLCYRLLPQYPTAISAYEKKINALEPFEKYRIHALALEKRHDYRNAAKAWAGAAAAMAQVDGDRNNRLIPATFLRRAAECADLGDGFFSPAAKDYLQKSLELDPDDLPTFNRLFKIHKDLDHNAYRSCVERAVKQFPEDSGVLMAAIDLAIERNTFKKATRYATALLAIDPINPQARALLVRAHLSHAGKLIVQKKFQLAGREIDAAEGFESGNRPSGSIPLHRGLLEYAQGNETQGEVLVDLACKTIGNYLSGYFRAVVEMSRVKLAPRVQNKYLTLLRNASATPPDKTIFLGLIKEIQQVSRERDFDLSAVMPFLKKALSAAISLTLSSEEMEMTCDTFQSVKMYQPLANFSSAAARRWPDLPVFDYFVVYARSRGIPENMSPMDSRLLQDAIDRAHQQNNIRVANRLIDYFERAVFTPNFGDELALPAEFAEIIERLIDGNPDLAARLNEIFAGEDGNSDELPVKKRRKSRRKPSPADPYNRDIFDD